MISLRDAINEAGATETDFLDALNSVERCAAAEDLQEIAEALSEAIGASSSGLSELRDIQRRVLDQIEESCENES